MSSKCDTLCLLGIEIVIVFRVSDRSCLLSDISSAVRDAGMNFYQVCKPCGGGPKEAPLCIR